LQKSFLLSKKGSKFATLLSKKLQMSVRDSKDIKKKRILSVIIISLFFFWGLANNMTDTMLRAFKQILNMSGNQTFFIKFAFYGAYFCFSLPAFFFIKKHAYKNGIIFGLLLYAIGAMLFFPAAGNMSYAFYLTAIYIMAAGCAFLETVANPYILSMEDDPATGIRMLNFAQSFNPAGSILGITICNSFILNTLDATTFITPNPEIVREELDTITIIYAGVGQIMLLFMMILLFMNVPNYAGRIMLQSSFSKSFKRLFKNSAFALGLPVMFLYIGAQVGTWTYTVPVLISTADMTPAQATSSYMTAMFAFMVGRFLFTFLMKYYQPQNLLLAASIGALLCTITVMFASGAAVTVSVIGISFFMSMIFATVFGCSLNNAKHDRQLGGALLVMAISGGAVITPIQGAIADKLGTQTSFVIPALCFLAVLFFAVQRIYSSPKNGFTFDMSSDEDKYDIS
jgi:FHS family L-fucose permease-like MFS transporter